MNDTSGLTSSSLSGNAALPSSSASKSPRRKSSATKEKDREYQEKYRKRNRARDLMRHARFRAMKQGEPFDLDQWLPELQKRIDSGLCEISGMPFNLDGGRTWDSPSFDRINPEGGYPRARRESTPD